MLCNAFHVASLSDAATKSKYNLDRCASSPKLAAMAATTHLNFVDHTGWRGPHGLTVSTPPA